MNDTVTSEGGKKQAEPHCCREARRSQHWCGVGENERVAGSDVYAISRILQRVAYSRCAQTGQPSWTEGDEYTKMPTHTTTRYTKHRALRRHAAAAPRSSTPGGSDTTAPTPHGHDEVQEKQENTPGTTTQACRVRGALTGVESCGTQQSAGTGNGTPK